MSFLRHLLASSAYTFQEEGLASTLKKTGIVFTTKGKSAARAAKLKLSKNAASRIENAFYDVIFINGCDYSLPHPIRYRVDHQIEQLKSAGLSCLKVDAPNLSLDHLRQGRVFVIYRFPYTEFIDDFIHGAKMLNKRVLYDIDDLVIDTKYTNAIPFLDTLDAQERALYDEGVIRMGKTLKLCDGAITTTEALAAELENYVPKVYINRNTASDGLLGVSEEAIFRRDKLPHLANPTQYKHSVKLQEKWRQRNESDDIVIGYFSGSISHNPDFKLVIPALKRLMSENEHVKLMIMGELDVPAGLGGFESRVIKHPFCPWTKLPFYIAECDINIAPLEDSLFNRAKSENKWVEASLVKVPTIASDVGAFHDMIEDGVTGLLCASSEDWYENLKRLADDPSLRHEIAENAYEYCKTHCTTIRTASNIKKIIDDCITPNIAFVLPSLQVSGGVMVALKHGAFLQDAGYDVSFIDVRDNEKWVHSDGHSFPVLDRMVDSPKLDNCPFKGWFDTLVATLWDTLDFALRYPKVRNVLYLVQGYEVDFYQYDDIYRIFASRTYHQVPRVKYLTVSKWCEGWLKDQYGDHPVFIPNGLDVGRFAPAPRDWNANKIRVLVEGDCEAEFKNIDEAFEIANGLDPERFEVWYMNYTGKSKPHYRIDKNLGSVPQDEVADVYRQCHILLKTSMHESFSYPPLEMMSTGGIVIARPNEGNVEYLEDGVNCLFYSSDDLYAARALFDKIVGDEELREKLIAQGIATAGSRDWKAIRQDILDAYG